VIDAFSSIGLERCVPKGTIYIWQKVPKGSSSVDFAKKLLQKDVAVVTTPGNWLSRETGGPGGGVGAGGGPRAAGKTKGSGGSKKPCNPGEGYVRLALVPPLDKVEEAARRIKNLRI
jgi:LL-diaminopimelate aminotransferase